MSDSGLILPGAARKAGLGAEALIYFERLFDGRLIIPAVWWAQPPVCKMPNGHERYIDGCCCGYVRKEANTAADLDRISKRFEKQKQDDFRRIDDIFAAKLEKRMSEIRARLHRSKGMAKSQRAKDAIDYILKRLEDGERAIRYRNVEGHLAIQAEEAPRGKS